MGSELEEFVEYSKKAIKEVVDYFIDQEASIPYRESKLTYLSFCSAGSYSEKEFYQKDVFFSNLLTENKESIEKLTHIKMLGDICSNLNSKYNKELTGLILFDHMTLIFGYLNKKKKFIYDELLIENIAEECYKHVTSKKINIIYVISFENIESDNDFIINNISINKITQKQLKLYSRSRRASFSSTNLWLKDDSWVAKITYVVEKKKYRETLNSRNNIIDEFINAVRLSFGKSGISTRLISKTIKENYLDDSVSWSTSYSTLNNDPYEDNVFYIDKDKKKEIRQLHKLLIKLREYPDQLNGNIYFALRKYLSSQRKTDLGDSFVDMTTGLESLLCSDSESEISYRFRMRGANILGKQRGSVEYRVNIMKDIYSLRSSIVHGNSCKKKLYSVNSGKIDIDERLYILTPIALSVFSDIIKWYLAVSVEKYYPKKKDAKLILQDIDYLMVNAKLL